MFLLQYQRPLFQLSHLRFSLTPHSSSPLTQSSQDVLTLMYSFCFFLCLVIAEEVQFRQSPVEHVLVFFVFLRQPIRRNCYMKNVTFLLTCLPCINSEPLFKTICFVRTALRFWVWCLFSDFVLFAAWSRTAFVASACHWDAPSVVSRPDDVPLTGWTLKRCTLDAWTASVCSHLTMQIRLL